MQQNTTFYEGLPLLEDFSAAVNPDHFHHLPEDWLVVVTDIANSTEAIQRREYKNVNILGVSPIVAFLNEAGEHSLPYTFGGDGSIICIPPDLKKMAQNILKSCRQHGFEAFNLKLRTAIIPVSFIYEKQKTFQIARLKITGNYIQALFFGDGLTFAEEWLKDEPDSRFHITESKIVAEVDFTGLECRWKELKYPKQEILTLLVYSSNTWSNSRDTYQNVILKLQQLLGFDKDSNPVNPESLNMNLSYRKLRHEVQFRTSGKGWADQFMYLLKIQLKIILGKIFMKFGYTSSETDWRRYKYDFARHTDHRKFDGMLRAVIKSSPAQRKKLEAFLQKEFQNKNLAYGTCVSDAAIVTCMVFKYHRAHIHFIDGKNGGYARAAEQLKAQIGQLEQKNSDQ